MYLKVCYINEMYYYCWWWTFTACIPAGDGHSQPAYQQPEAQRTAVIAEVSLDVDNPPAAKAMKKTLAIFFKNSTHLPTTVSASTTSDPVVQCREAVIAELSTYVPCVGHGEVVEVPENTFSFAIQTQKYLCIHATSSASERAFSTSSNFVSVHCSCLKPDKVDMLGFYFVKEPLKW